MFTLADMVNCTPSNYIPHFPHFPTEIHHWGECVCLLYRRERSLWWARARLAGLPLKLLLAFELWMTMGSVAGLPSNWSQVVVLGKQICICSAKSGSSYGSVSPLLVLVVMLFGFGVIGLGSAWDLISVDLSLNYQLSEVWQSWTCVWWSLAAVQKGLCKSAALIPSWHPRRGHHPSDHVSWWEKSGRRLQTGSSFFLVLFYSWPYVESVCKML